MSDVKRTAIVTVTLAGMVLFVLLVYFDSTTSPHQSQAVVWRMPGMEAPVPTSQAPTLGGKATAQVAETPFYNEWRAKEMANRGIVWFDCFDSATGEYQEACAHYRLGDKTMQPFHDGYMDGIQNKHLDPAIHGRKFGIITGWPEQLYACKMKPWNGGYRNGRPVWELEGQPRLVAGWRRGQDLGMALRRACQE